MINQRNGTGDIIVIQSLAELFDRYDLMICDLWGVMHNGITLNPEAVAAITAARKHPVQTIFLSNAPRPRYYVREHLLSMGLDAALADLIVTSGGLARDHVRDKYPGARLYHLGPEGDRNTVEGLPVNEVDHPDEAEVILATDLDFTTPEAHRDWLAKAAQKRVPLLCANPDRVVHVGDKLYHCAGAVADLYQAMGGPVVWFGKPVASALHACVPEAGLEEKYKASGARVLMIGDSLKTDIAGARAAGFDSLLVASGIYREALLPLIAGTSSARLTGDIFEKSLLDQGEEVGFLAPDFMISDLR